MQPLLCFLYIPVLNVSYWYIDMITAYLNCAYNIFGFYDDTAM